MTGDTTRWIDSHCHVSDEEDLDAFARARANGVEACVVIGTDEESSKRALRVARRSAADRDEWPTRFATVGLHPHDASTGTTGIAALIAQAVVPVADGRPAGSVVAVGECGLDYFYEHSPRDAQRVAFAEQIALAHAHDLTLVVHTRDAWDDTFAVLDEAGVPPRTVIHCFTGGPVEARRCLEIGAYLSFSGIVTFKNAGDVRDAAQLCPGDRLLVETDSPYLAPVPHRGRPNEPAYVATVGAFVAGLRGEEPDELAATTRTNTTASVRGPLVTARGRIGRSDAHRLLAEHGLEASRALGQNFVVDPNTVERIVRLAGVGPGDTVVEIGAGLGSLTLPLADSGAAVTAIEIDRHLLPILREIVGDRARIVEGDAMELDWHDITGDRTGVVVVSNLPYNIATPLVITLLERVPALERFVVMVQKEVADRMAAPPGNKTYGAVSVRIAYFATARVLGTVSPEVFIPRPRVTSAIVEITRRVVPAVAPEIASYREIDELVRAGFGGRRKMLRRSLAGLVGDDAFVAAGVDPTARAEELAVDRWGTLAACRRNSAPSPS